MNFSARELHPKTNPEPTQVKQIVQAERQAKAKKFQKRLRPNLKAPKSPREKEEDATNWLRAREKDCGRQMIDNRK